MNKENFLTPLNVQPYERYLPSAFDNSLSILEKINKVIYQMNHVGVVTNGIIEQWNNLIEWITGEGLEQSVEEAINAKIADGTFDALFADIVGLLVNLTTNDKTNVVSAINEINGKYSQLNNEIIIIYKQIGNMNNLTTNEKIDLVSAIGEIVTRLEIVEQDTLSIGEATGYGVISGLKVTQQNVLAMAVNVGDVSTPNIVHMGNGVRYTPNTTTVSIAPAESSSRTDVVYVNMDGVISYLKGSTANYPNPPVVDGVKLAHINVVPNDTTINDIDITDVRPLKSLQTLNTNGKENLVVAINEVNSELQTFMTNINIQLGDIVTSINDEILEQLEKVRTLLIVSDTQPIEQKEDDVWIETNTNVIDYDGVVDDDAWKDIPTGNGQTLENKLVEMEAEIDSKTTMSEVMNIIDNIELPDTSNYVVERLKGLTWNVLGDSITESAVPLGKAYHAFIAERTGINVNNYGISLSTVSNMVGNASGQDPSYYSPMVERYQNMVNANIVTVMAGVNDWGHNAPIGTFDSRDPNTFYGALHVLLVGLLTKYPTSGVGYIIEPMGNPESEIQTFIPYYEAIKEVCEYYKIPYLDLLNSSQLTNKVQARKDLLIADGIHPTEKGHELISKQIEMFIRTL